jgi:hypothetical protein
VYDFWWDRTTHPKVVPVTGSKVFDPPDFVDIVDELADWAVAALSLGLVDVDVDLDKVWADFGATIGFSKFTFDLLPGNSIQVSGTVTLDIWIKLYVQITTTTSLFWGLWEVDETTNTVKIFDLSVSGLTINIENAVGTVALDAQHRLTADLTDLELFIPLPWDIPEFLLNAVVNWVTEKVVDEMPPVVLFPAVIDQKLPGTAVNVSVTGETLEINETEALITANIATSGAETYAPYVGNKNSLEVHLRDCEWAHKISWKNRVFYCTLEDALSAGYNGCAFCLPRYDTG